MSIAATCACRSTTCARAARAPRHPHHSPSGKRDGLKLIGLLRRRSLVIERPPGVASNCLTVPAPADPITLLNGARVARSCWPHRPSRHTVFAEIPSSKVDGDRARCGAAACAALHCRRRADAPGRRGDVFDGTLTDPRILVPRSCATRVQLPFPRLIDEITALCASAATASRSIRFAGRSAGARSCRLLDQVRDAAAARAHHCGYRRPIRYTKAYHRRPTHVLSRRLERGCCRATSTSRADASRTSTPADSSRLRRSTAYPDQRGTGMTASACASTSRRRTLGCADTSRLPAARSSTSRALANR